MSEWIKVKDRLPEDGVYLAFDGSIEIMWYWPDTGWNNYEGPTNPTHWMQLPNDPKD